MTTLLLGVRDAPAAREVYLESIGVSADCLEAIYNLGIVNVPAAVLCSAMRAEAEDT